MDDLALLGLLEKAQVKQKGEQGPPGVGIRSLEQNDNDSITFRFTDGTFKVVTLPKPKDGETGPQGIIGATGATGPTGSPGRNGANGRDGRDG